MVMSWDTWKEFPLHWHVTPEKTYCEHIIPISWWLLTIDALSLLWRMEGWCVWHVSSHFIMYNRSSPRIDFRPGTVSIPSEYTYPICATTQASIRLPYNKFLNVDSFWFDCWRSGFHCCSGNGCCVAAEGVLMFVSIQMKYCFPLLIFEDFSYFLTFPIILYFLFFLFQPFQMHLRDSPLEY